MIYKPETIEDFVKEQLSLFVDSYEENVFNKRGVERDTAYYNLVQEYTNSICKELQSRIDVIAEELTGEIVDEIDNLKDWVRNRI